MTILQIISLLITFTALLSYVNHRWVGLPTTIGVMFLGILFSLLLLLSEQLGFGTAGHAKDILGQVNFDETLMQGMLSFLLFAGALHVDLSELAKNKWIIGALATFGVLLSTLLVGFSTWHALGFLGIELPLVFCLLFGALISPTDPIAVLSILKSAGASRSLEIKITGESLFNDGVGIVVFIIVSSVAFAHMEPTVASVSLLFVEEAVGGALLGAALGWLGCQMLGKIDEYKVEVLLTLALVMGGYSFANLIHVSGPIAVVIAGLIIGNHGRINTMSERTRRHLDAFWELVDEILNAVLFVLIGLEILLIPFHLQTVGAGFLAILLVLCARFISVSLPVLALQRRREFSPHAIKILTWGGLRGGISIALALSLPPGGEREIILTITYIIVMFSILAQGLTMGKLIQWTQQRGG